MIELQQAEFIDKFEYVKKKRNEITTKKILLNWITPCDRPLIPLKSLGIEKMQLTFEVTGTLPEIEQLKEHQVFHIALVEGELYAKTPISKDLAIYGYIEIDNRHYLTVLSIDASEPPFTWGDKFTLKAGDIDNYTGADTVTDFGKYVVNQVILAKPFKDKIPYINAEVSPSKTDKLVADLIVKKQITRKEFNDYMRNGYWFGSDASITTATMTEKAMVTDPRVAKRRAELLEQHKDELDDPQVTVAIEQELISMDKAWLSDDPSHAFYKADGGKVFKEQRKKMHLMFGTGIAFDKDTNKYTFYGKPLSEGWDATSIPICANDTRRGSYGRGIDTAKGGEQTKFLLRIFQEVSITEEDCGAKTGIRVLLTENIASQYFGRHMLNGVTLTKENYKTFLGETVELRSPMHCKTVNGFCYTCCGQSMKDIGMIAIGMQAIRISSKFTSTSMKAQHASSANSTTIKHFSRFLV